MITPLPDKIDKTGKVIKVFRDRTLAYKLYRSEKRRLERSKPDKKK